MGRHEEGEQVAGVEAGFAEAALQMSNDLLIPLWLAHCMWTGVQLGALGFEPARSLFLVTLGNESVVVGRLNEATHKSARISCRHSPGACNGGEEGELLRFGRSNDAGGNGCSVNPLPAFGRAEVERLEMVPYGLRSTSSERLVCLNFVRKGLVL